MPDNDRADDWRRHLERALADPESSLVLGDTTDATAVLQTRSRNPMHLLNLARMLVEQARDGFDTDATDESEAMDMVDVCDGVLALLPDPHADDDGD